MTTEVVSYQHQDNLPALTAEQVRARVNLIQQVMRGVMKEGTHYGRIPGAGDKPSLFKPGAETLAVTFRIAVDPLVEDLSSEDEAHFRIVCRGIHQDTGALLGSGIGEASSNEEKYRWRRAVCDEEYEATTEDRRRVKWGKGKGGSTYTVKQVRTSPADVANTVLKMAKKRAQVDMTLSVTGASDIFAQDIEDLPEGLRSVIVEEEDGTPAVSIIGEFAHRALLDLMAVKGVTESQVKTNLSRKERFEGDLTELPVPMWERLMAGLAKMPDKTPPDEPEPIVDAEVVDEEPIPTDPNGEVIDEDLPGYGPENLDDFTAEQEAAAERKASQRQLAKVAVLMKEREADTETVRKWMQAKWSISSRSQLDKDQAGQLIEFLSGLPMHNEGTAA